MTTLAAGTITNPNFPLGFTDSTGKALTGGWTFSSDVILQFDYHSVLHALKSFGIYTQADFRLNNDLTFDFEPFIGNKQPQLKFQYGTRGNVVNYNAPRIGSKMVNDYYGIAYAPDGTLLHTQKTDEPSKAEYGLMQGALAFTDVKDQNSLGARLNEDLFLVKDPQNSPLSFVLDENAYPLGQWDVGDIVTAKIVDGAINLETLQRVVGYTVNLNGTGKELTTVQLNVPRPGYLTA